VSSARHGIPQISGFTHIRLISSAGGYGDVHLYADDELGRQVAVKVIRDVELSQVAVQRFVAEGNAMAALDHPNIVRIYRAGRTLDGRPFIAMQFCGQATLEQRAAHGTLGLADVLQAGVSIGGALETAHRAGLLHRDVKPANILTQPSGEPALTDFGVAASMTSQAHDDEVGVSPPWSPPEMLFSDTQGSPASDVYSLAATLWHLLVGHSPFEVPGGDNRRAALLARIRSQELPPTRRPDVPGSLELVLRRAMAKRPERRPQTMTAFIHELQQVQREMGLPITSAVTIDVAYLAGPIRSQARHEVQPGASAEPWAGSPDPATPTPNAEPRPGVDEQHGERTQLRPGTAQLIDTGTNTASSVGGERTQLRPRTSEVDIPRGPDPAPSRRSKGLLIGAVVVLLVGAIAGAFILLGRGGSPSARTAAASPSTAVNGAAAEDAIPPGVAQIKGTRSAGSATFTWTYSAALPDDTFQWEIVGGVAGPQVTKEPQVTVPAPPGQQTCLRVKVVRFDGSNPQREWSPQGCVQ
jgi:serine/threonine protein kinase